MEVRLVLEDGSSFEGEFFGREKSVSGEVVFNTGMVGYPESLTDPSYAGQILVLTYPLIGNYGVPGMELDNLGLPRNFESERIQPVGVIVSEYVEKYSHWNAKKDLGEWMAENDVPGMTGVDTRRLTKKLREKGVMLGKIEKQGENLDFEDPNLRNLASEVSIKEKKVYNKDGNKRVIVIDCGVKTSIIRTLCRKNCRVIRVPWDYNFLNEEFDGILISNGPGDPKMAKETVQNVRKALEREIPTMGICLGNQILALAAGGDTYKLKYGHRSQNQPCIQKETKECFITTQNHGFAVDAKTLGEDWKEWFVNANDGTNEGIMHKSKPFFSFQAHPEARPGPVDAEWIFDKFLEALN